LGGLDSEWIVDWIVGGVGLDMGLSKLQCEGAGWVWVGGRGPVWLGEGGK
jgi:hypothetical protein